MMALLGIWPTEPLRFLTDKEIKFFYKYNRNLWDQDMNIKHVFEDSRIVMLEKDIARINEYCQYSDKEKFVMKHLLEKRCNVLWQLNVYDDETKQLLIGFNDALRKACTQLYHRTMTVYQEYQNRKDISGDFEVEGKIFLGYEYPALHPIQTETAKQVWDALTCGGFNALYDEGCAWPLRFSSERPPEQNINEKLENWLGMEIENDNWNEGLNREWSKDLHLIQPFHNLYDHCYFSLYDLIYVREFNLEVHVEFDDKVKY